MTRTITILNEILKNLIKTKVAVNPSKRVNSLGIR